MDGIATVAGRRRLHWFVVALSLVLTLLAWSVATRALEQRNAQAFGRRADKVLAQFVEQLQRHADILTAAAGLVMASEEVTPDEWRRFITTLNIEAQFPTLSAIGVLHRASVAEAPDSPVSTRADPVVATRPPADGRSMRLTMVHATPARLASDLEGLDLAHEPHLREAALRAARLGTAQLSEPVALTDSGTPGVFMVVPFYRGGPSVAPEARGEQFAGAVVASMLLENLAAGTLDPATRQIRVRISDDAEPLYTEIDGPREDIDPTPMHSQVRHVPVYGRRWRIEVHSTLGFREDANRLQPLLVLVGGLCIDALLLALLLLHARTERRLRRAAGELREESTALALSNEKLEAFACVASHDLKAPLIAIRTLVGFVEEDLEIYLRGNDAAPAVADNLARVRQQVARADALVEGILDYSGLDDRDEPCERVDTRALLGEIAEMLDVGSERLRLSGELPVFETNATRLRQVLTNLIGNAFKYHHDASTAHVHVSIEDAGTRYRFLVSDDGPGIPAHLHERIFEPFDTGRAEKGPDGKSSGIGLAIVRKSIRTMGGTISLDSAPGRGSTFTFDWPKRIERAHDGEPDPHRGGGAAGQLPPVPVRRAA